MLDKYELLIKLWVDDASSNGASFKYGGRSADGATVSMLFNEAIIKRTLRKLVLCVSNNELQLGKYKALDGVKAAIEPLYPNILDVDYVYSEVSDKDLSVIAMLDEQVFASWLIYVMKNELLPMASELDGWNENQDKGESQ